MGFCLGQRADRADLLRADIIGTIVAPPGSVVARFGYMKGKLVELLDYAQELDEDVEVVTEQPGVWGSKVATIMICRVGGLIFGEIGARKLRHTEYLPQVWKRVTGAGNASKDRVAQFIRNLLQLPSIPAPDAADAGGMFAYHATRGR